MHRYFCMIAAALFLTGPAIAAPDNDTVTGRIENVTTLGSPAFDVKAEFNPNNNFADGLEKSDYGIGDFWSHVGLWQGQATMSFTFVEDDTDTPTNVGSFAVKISDIDKAGNHGLGNEIFRISGAEQVRVTSDTILNVSVLDPAQKRVEITSNGKVNGSDTNDAIVTFAGGTGFTLDYETTKGWSAAVNGGGISIRAPGDGENFTTIAAEPGASIPVPAAIAFLGTGLLGLGCAGIRRARIASS